MRKVLTGLTAMLLVLLVGVGIAADAVQPATLAVTSLRGEAVTTVSGTFYTGSTLLLTNCVIYSGTTTNSDVQGLDGVDVEVRVGRASTNVATAATVDVAASGTWYASVTVPTDVVADKFSLQVKITDADTNIFIYPWKTVNVTTALDD